MDTVTEAARDIPVVASYDVVVAGGGVSGVAAAMGAAKAGARTLLIERSGALGGIATAGLMANISNRFFTSDNKPVLGGAALELVQRLVQRGGASAKWATQEVPGITFDPEIFKLVLIEALNDAHADALLLSQISNVIMAGGRLDGLVVDNISGRQAIRAKATVDATGDALVAYLAGAPCKEQPSNGSLEFRMAGVNVDRFVDYYRAHPEDYPSQRDRAMPFESFERNWRERGVFFFPHGGGKVTDLVQQHVREGQYSPKQGQAYDLDAFGLYAYGDDGVVTVNSNFFVTDLDAWAGSKRELEARQMVYYAADFLDRYVPGFERAKVVATAEYVGVRASRWIEGEFTLPLTSQEQPQRYDDVVAITPCQGRAAGGGGMVLLADYLDIPYRILLPKQVEGLIVGSGKTVSTEPRAALRGMSRCMPLGQAAGVAAALAARRGISLRDVSVPELQKALLAQKAILGDSTRLAQLDLA